MRNVNAARASLAGKKAEGFILTMRNVNVPDYLTLLKYVDRFILTMRNVNGLKLKSKS